MDCLEIALSGAVWEHVFSLLTQSRQKKHSEKQSNPMLEHTLTVASMLLIAFLSLGGAQAAGEMPAELEINLDRVTQEGLGYHIKGTIPLQLPDGDESFVVEEVMRSYWNIAPVQRKCRSNVAFITLRVAGRRDRDRLTVALSLTPVILRPSCDDDKPMEPTYESMVDTVNLNSTEFSLAIAEGSDDERTLEDPLHLVKLTGKLTLHLACPVRLMVSESEPLISVLPTETLPWPLRFDDSKTPAELRALDPSAAAVVGATRPSRPYPPVAFFRVASKHAFLRPGFCVWVKSVQVEFTPIEILLASKYSPGSCEYNVIRDHEMLHYQDMQALFIRYRARVLEAVRLAGLPTIERPVFVGSVAEGTDQIETRLQSTLQPLYALMEEARQADAGARDAPEQRVLSWSKCPSWYAAITSPVTIP